MQMSALSRLKKKPSAARSTIPRWTALGLNSLLACLTSSAA